LGTAQLTESGSYLIDAFDQSMTLYTQSGSGLLYSTPQRAVVVGTANQGFLKRDEATATIQPYPYIMLNLPQPGSVQSFLAPMTTDPGDKILPALLGCTNPTPDDPTEPTGKWQISQVDGLLVMHMFRENGGQVSQPLGHAETSCKFYFSKDPVQMDLHKFSSLSVQIKMKIHSQDVTTCGIRGSECPVMVRLDYNFLDAQNQPQAQVWYQGFYAARPPEDNNILRCDNCPRDHEQISEDAWYLYDSGDLLKQLPRNQLPASLNSVTIYSSGHQYDVAISDLEVLGGLIVNEGS
jgi:hypothetical protein